MGSYLIKRTKAKDLIDLYDKQAFTWVHDYTMSLKVEAELSVSSLEEMGAEPKEHIRFYITEASLLNQYYEFGKDADELTFGASYPKEAIFCSVLPEDLQNSDFKAKKLVFSDLSETPLRRFGDMIDMDVDFGRVGLCFLTGEGSGANLQNQKELLTIAKTAWAESPEKIKEIKVIEKLLMDIQHIE